MRRAGQIVAAALVWPVEETDENGQEVSFLALPYEGTTADGDLRACLAHVYATSPLGSILLIDSHVTERNESTVVAGLPGKSPDPRDKWTAIVAVPAATGPAVRPLDPSLIPAAAAWAW
ncbi:hypothetical protein BSZ40_08915 [Buchananella hordeovulneris]|uniref:Uncharacterized protein n=2 Tax=Buchananella hordeovulneris TaxID=52770 RepID=A0A1Q5PUL9_9ACTO|nr:hypothetical protein BSZ40_08915 [Buchananella hordeovulneris]